MLKQAILAIVHGFVVLLAAPGVAAPAAQTEVDAAKAASPEARLRALGIELPPAPTPVASYVPTLRTGNLVFIAGQGPVSGGKATVTGKVGAEITEAEGYQIARNAALNGLAALRAEIGSLDRVRRVVKVVGWVNSAPGFTRQPWVINGASDLLVEVFGDAGRHARSAVSANELPLDIPVEIDFIVEVEPESGDR
jgi:enamine deaminase RidA (YjgF/YER057c/UK114 family)